MVLEKGSRGVPWTDGTGAGRLSLGAGMVRELTRPARTRASPCGLRFAPSKTPPALGVFSGCGTNWKRDATPPECSGALR